MSQEKTIRGRAAISYAEQHGLSVLKYADPIEGSRRLTLDEARAVADVDPGLLYVFAAPECDTWIHDSEPESEDSRRERVDIALRNTDPAPRAVFAGIVGRGVRVESVHVDGQVWERPGKLAPAQYAEDGAFPSKREADALAFCFRVAPMGYGGARRIRQALFAWHNAGELGGFDLTDLWSLDEEHRGALLTLISMIGRSPCGWYARHYGYEADMMALIETYGPGAIPAEQTERVRP